MKAKFYLVIGLLLAFTSCHEEDMNVISVEKQGVIHATLEQGTSSSRMLIDVEDNSLTWAAGDEFKIYRADGVQNSDWRLKPEDAGKSSATFTGTEIDGDLGGAVYPSSIAKSFTDNVLTVELPSSIVYAGNNLNAPMWASLSTWGESVSFNHLCALLKVNLKEIPDAYRIMTIESKPSIAGTFTYDTSSDLSETTGLVPQSLDEGVVTVDFSDYTLPDDKNLWFFLPLPAVEYESIKICLSKTKDDDTPQVLSEWNNRKITRAKVYRTSLTYKEIDVTTPSEVTTQLSSSVSAENKTVTLSMTETITATAGNNTITIPAISNASSNVALNFAKTPDTSENSLVIAEDESNGATDTDNLEISAPSDAAFEKLIIDTPNTTVTIKEGKYGTITATTAVNTMIIEEGVVVDNIVVKGGNVKVRGQVTNSITRDSSNTDSETFVIVELATASVPSITDSNIIRVDPFSWYQSDATTLTIADRGELVSFLAALYGTSDFSGKTVLLDNDIDMQECELDVQGMIFKGANFAYFAGTFDGQGKTIKNLKLNYVPAEENDLATYNDVFVGLIPAAQSAVIQNVTLENGKVSVPSVSPDLDYVHVGLLTGYARAIDVINCHNVNSESLSAAPGYVGGLIGSTGANSGVYTNIIGCSNSGTVVSTYTGDEIASAGGIYGYGWGKYSTVVACYNLGSVSVSASNSNSRAGGIVGNFGGGNYMYACFNQGEASGVSAGDLMGETSYSSSVYNSCYVGSVYYGYSVGQPFTDEVRQCSYTDAVKVLNTGIEYYNTLGKVPCEYRFVSGSSPALEVAGETGDGTGTPGLGEGSDL